MSNDKPDYYAMAEGISKTIGKVTKPLTDAQFIALAGAVAVYVEKALAHEAEKQAGPVAGKDDLSDMEWIAEWAPKIKEFHTHELHGGGSVLHPDCITDALKKGLMRGLDCSLSSRPAPPSESDKDDAELTQAAQHVLAERQRQISAEGWTPEHDDTYVESDDLAKAAAAYAMCSVVTDRGHLALSLWPWDPSWFKPSDSRRNLIKAGALILAEIERLDRADRAKKGQS